MISFLDRLLRKVGYVRKSSLTAQAVKAYYEGQVIWQAASMEDFLKSYMFHPWVYSGVFAIASAAASVDFRIYKVKEGPETEELPIFSEPNKLFSRPNPYMCGFDLWEATFSFMMLTGNLFWEIVTEPLNGKPVELYPLMPHRVAIIPGELGPREYQYRIDQSSEPVHFKPEEILHIKFFHPLSDFVGLSPLNPVAISLATDFYAMAFNANFFKKGAKIYGVLETDRNLSDPQYVRLRKQFEDLYVGPSKAHRAMILEGGLKYRQVGVTQKDMEFTALRESVRREVLGAEKVPEAEVGFYQTKASALLQKRSFWEETMEPLFKKICSNLNQFLLPKFDSNLVCNFDTSQVSALRDGEKLKVEIDKAYVESGLRTINELRKRDHLKTVPWGDTWHRPVNRRAVSLVAEEEPKEPESKVRDREEAY